MAVAEVLRQQGVDVVPTAGLDDDPRRDRRRRRRRHRAALGRRPAARLRPARRGCSTPRTTSCRSTRPSSSSTTWRPASRRPAATAGTFDADCDLPAVEQAGTVVGEGSAYRIADVGDRRRHRLPRRRRPATASCRSTHGGGTVTLLGRRPSVLTNEHVAAEGNAALALNLLGAARHAGLVHPVASTTSTGRCRRHRRR